VLSGPAIEKIENSSLEEFIATNTINFKGSSKKIKILSVARLLGDAISRIHEADSVSSLFV